MTIDNKTLYYLLPLREAPYNERLVALRYEVQKSCQTIQGYAKLLNKELLKKQQTEIVASILSDLEIVRGEVASCIATIREFKSSDTSKADTEIVFKTE